MRNTLVKVRCKAEWLCLFHIRVWGRMAGPSKWYHFLIMLMAPPTTAHNQRVKVTVRKICLIKKSVCDSKTPTDGRLLENFLFALGLGFFFYFSCKLAAMGILQQVTGNVAFLFNKSDYFCLACVLSLQSPFNHTCSSTEMKCDGNCLLPSVFPLAPPLPFSQCTL